MFRSDIKTVIINPLDLDFENKRKYYNELSTPIKTAIKKASQQLKISSENGEYKITIIVNNGLSMTLPDEFFDIAVRRAKNDTSNIDMLIICGIYHFSDGFDTIATAMFKDVEIQNKEKPIDFIDKLREAWSIKVNEYMTQQIISNEIERTKPPIKDIYFELNNIRYVKPPIQWGKESDFYGKQGRPRFDTTGMESCPPVGVVMPIFDLESYNFVKENISIFDSYLLKNNLEDYLKWIEKERIENDDFLKPIVPIKVSKEELIKTPSPFSFKDIGISLLPIFQKEVIKIAENSFAFNNTPISNNYTVQSNGSILYKGYLTGILNTWFGGVAYNELYFIRAEANARLGNTQDAISDLNTVLRARWRNGTFVPLTASSSAQALQLVITERNKDMPFMGRWQELKRLNLEPAFEKTLKRKIAGIEYILPPNDNRYALPISPNEILLSGLIQNPR